MSDPISDIRKIIQSNNDITSASQIFGCGVALIHSVIKKHRLSRQQAMDYVLKIMENTTDKKTLIFLAGFQQGIEYEFEGIHELSFS